MFGSDLLKSLAAVAVLTVMAGGAQAAVCQFGTAAEFTATADVYTSTACVGEIDSENDSAAFLNAYDPDGAGGVDAGMFGATNWLLDSRYDKNGTYAPAGILTVSDITADLFEGTWSVSNWAGVAQAVIVIKGGNGFAAYLLDITAGIAGEWSTQALEVGKNNNQPAVSHISLYISPAPVPVPAAGFLLLGALGGLAALRRRRSV